MSGPTQFLHALSRCLLSGVKRTLCGHGARDRIFHNQTKKPDNVVKL